MAHRYCLEFSKKGEARFMGHLELEVAFARMFRSAFIPIAFSERFHQRPRIQFEEALPLGWTSERERVWVECTQPYPSQALLARVKRECLPGIQILRAFPWVGKPRFAENKRFQVSGLHQIPMATRVHELFPPHLGVQVSAALDAKKVDWVISLAGKVGSTPSLKTVLKKVLGNSYRQDFSVNRLVVGGQV